MLNGYRGMALIAGALSVVGTGCKNRGPAEARAEVSAPVELGSPSAADDGGSTRSFAIGKKDSLIAFEGAKVTMKHEGAFKEFAGTVVLADGTIESGRITVEIDLGSVWTDTEQLTGHLQSADFFDVQKYAKATFVSTSIAKSDKPGSTHVVTGNLDLHGVKKSVSFPATIVLHADGFTASGEFSLDRTQFGIVYPGMADDLIRDDVLVKLSIRGAVSES